MDKLIVFDLYYNLGCFYYFSYRKHSLIYVSVIFIIRHMYINALVWIEKLSFFLTEKSVWFWPLHLTMCTGFGFAIVILCRFWVCAEAQCHYPLCTYDKWQSPMPFWLCVGSSSPELLRLSLLAAILVHLPPPIHSRLQVWHLESSVSWENTQISY